jgi:hypothetical protein
VIDRDFFLSSEPEISGLLVVPLLVGCVACSYAAIWLFFTLVRVAVGWL